MDLVAASAVSYASNSTIVRSIPGPARLTLRAASALAPRTTARWLADRFLAPRRHAPPSRELEWLRGARHGTLATPVGELAWTSWGDGPPVALLHGWEGRASQMGAFGVALAAAGFRAVAVDAPAHGRSPGRHASLPAMAAALTSVVGELGGATAVVAHSAGTVATTLALADGLDVGRVVFLAPGGSPRVYTEIYAAALGLDPATVERLRRRVEERVGRSFAELDPLALAPRLATPLLAFHDEDDAELPLAVSRRLAGAWGGPAALRVTRGLGHRRILRDADVVRRAVGFVAAGADAAEGLLVAEAGR